MPMKPIRISARDRRLAAIHEAGHVVVGRHIGLVDISAWLVKVSDPATDDKSWIGHTRYPPPSPPLSKRRMAIFSVAGAVAECCWDKYAFEDPIDEQYWSTAEVMSQSDWDGCGCKPGKPTKRLFKIIGEAFALLEREKGSLWPELLSETRQLIENSRGCSQHTLRDIARR
jgi:hypothetical protein